MTADKRLLEAITERDFLGWVVMAARLSGWLAYHTLDSRGSEPGWPDLVLVRGPDLIFAELKSERGKVTAAQQAWLDALAAAGAETHVYRPSDRDAIEARLCEERGAVSGRTASEASHG